MQTNRSMPTIRVIPVLSYPDVNAAVEWLSSTFDFTLRWRAGNHRAQLNIIDGCVVVTKSADSQRGGHSVMVRVDDVDVHNSKVSALGARIIQPLTDYPYGERQYTVEDLAGHVWTFSQTILDVAPEEWGGVSANL